MFQGRFACGADHSVSYAIYPYDPEGNEVEVIYAG